MIPYHTLNAHAEGLTTALSSIICSSLVDAATDSCRPSIAVKKDATDPTGRIMTFYAYAGEKQFAWTCTKLFSSIYMVYTVHSGGVCVCVCVCVCV